MPGISIDRPDSESAPRVVHTTTGADITTSTSTTRRAILAGGRDPFSPRVVTCRNVTRPSGVRDRSSPASLRRGRQSTRATAPRSRWRAASSPADKPALAASRLPTASRISKCPSQRSLQKISLSVSMSATSESRRQPSSSLIAVSSPLARSLHRTFTACSQSFTTGHAAISAAIAAIAVSANIQRDWRAFSA